MTDKKLLEVRDLTYSYNNETGKKRVLQNVSFDIKRNEVVGIIGKNGSGKSTLFNCITGFNVNYEGIVFLNNKDLKKYNVKEMARNVSYLPQKYSSLPDFISVYDYILSGRRPYTTLGFDKTVDYSTADEAISFFNLYDFKDKKIDQLSGGEFQRVQLARIYTQKTDLIICDEPVSALDVKYQRDFFNNIKKMQETYGISALVSIHDLNLAIEFCSRIIVINNKSICFDGIPAELNEKDIQSTFEINTKKIISSVNNKERAYFIYY